MTNSELPILPTSVIGSYAWPSWLTIALETARRDELGPADVREVLDDAVDTAIRDQEDAGIDIISDGEMRRAGFFTAAFYGYLTGIRPIEPERKLGPAGHDMMHRFEVVEPIAAPDGLGVVAEYEYARQRTTRPIKVTIPGPFTLSGRFARGAVYGNRIDAAWAFVPILRAEILALQATGADFIQIDEPSPAIHPDSPADFAELFNATVEGVTARIGAHLCFGNFVGRPLAKRSYAPVLDQMMRFRADELALEFANRELAELELCAEIAQHKDIAAGLIDVKNYYVETAEDVAERIRQLLRYVPAKRVSIVPDCGYSQTARWTARAKLHAMVDGARIVRSELQPR